MKCPSFDQLVDFVEERLPPEDQRAVLDHMGSGCRRCQPDVEWVRDILLVMRTDASQAPPDWVIEPLLDHFDKVIEEKTPVSAWKKLAAVLVFDSLQQAEFAGVRNVRALAKQLLYQTDAYDIDIRLNPTESPQFESIIGQVLPRGENSEKTAGAKIRVCLGDEDVCSTLTNKLGIFTIYKLPQGKYDFKVLMSGTEIVIYGVSTSKFIKN